MKQYGFLIVAFSMLLSCGMHKEKVNDDVPPGKVRIKVSDAEINKGDLDAVLLPATWWIDPHGSADHYATASRRFSRELLMLNAMVTYLNDCRKEGHYLFLATTPPQVAKDAMDGFRAAGLGPYADVLAKALHQANSGEEDEDFELVDEELLDLNEKQDPMPMIWQFIRNNRKAFYYNELVNKPE